MLFPYILLQPLPIVSRISHLAEENGLKLAGVMTEIKRIIAQLARVYLSLNCIWQ